MSFKFGQSSLNNRAGVDPRLIEISDRAIALSPIDFKQRVYNKEVRG